MLSPSWDYALGFQNPWRYLLTAYFAVSYKIGEWFPQRFATLRESSYGYRKIG